MLRHIAWYRTHYAVQATAVCHAHPSVCTTYYSPMCIYTAGAQKYLEDKCTGGNIHVHVDDRRRVVTTVRRDLCSREKMSTDASKARADVARGTGVKMQGLSAIAEAMLYCTQASFFSSVVTCELQPFLERRCFWSTAESMRGILNSWLGGAAIALYRCDWWCR